MDDDDVTTTSTSVVERLVGVYDADGGWRGEAAYVVGKILGRAHCGLCDVTHGPLRRKAEWDAMAGTLGVSFDLVHLNERSSVVRAATDSAPSVLAQTASGLLVLLGPEQIDAVGGDVQRFRSVLLGALERAGLRLPQAASATS